MNLSHSVVICTRERNETLMSCIENLRSSHGFESLSLFIVLNGISSDLFEGTREELRLLGLSNLEVLRSSPGLAAARNMALANIKTQLVTFLDDDVEVPKNFFIEIDRVMSSNDEISGLSPRISGYYPFSSNNAFMQSTKWLHKDRLYGRLTNFGMNFWVPDDPDFPVTCVDWLPGCSMTFRTSRIVGMQFETALMNGPTGGYSLGEDVDFSSRVGALYSMPSTVIVHLQATSVRDNNMKMAQARGRWIAHLAKSKTNNVSTVRSVIWMVFSLGLSLVKDLSKTDIKFSRTRFKLIQIWCFVMEFFDPILVNKNE